MRQHAPSSTVFWNFLAVGSGEAIARLVAFAGLLFVARQVGAGGYGVISFAAGVTLYLTRVADFGIDTLGTVEIARHPDEISRRASAILTMRLVITAMLTVATIAVALLFLPEPDRTVFAVFALTLPPIAAGTKWIHIGLEAARPVGVWRVIGELVTLSLVLLIVRDTSHLWRLPAANAVGDVVAATVLFWLLKRRRYTFQFRWDPALAVPIFRRALPLVAQMIAVLFIYNSGVIFLRVLSSTEMVGYYAAAYTLLSFTENICTLYGMTLLPTLTRLGNRTLEERGLYHTALAQVFAVALPVSVGGMFLAPAIIHLAFGAAYAYSGGILQILIWAVLPFALRIVSAAALIANGHQNLAWRATAYAVVANLALNLVLIQAYGGPGAAVATIVTEILAGGWTFYYCHRHGLSIAEGRRFWRPLVAAATMSAVLWLCLDWPFGWQFAAGALTYALVLTSVGALRFRGAMPVLAV